MQFMYRSGERESIRYSAITVLLYEARPTEESTESTVEPYSTIEPCRHVKQNSNKQCTCESPTAGQGLAPYR